MREADQRAVIYRIENVARAHRARRALAFAQMRLCISLNGRRGATANLNGAKKFAIMADIGGGRDLRSQGHHRNLISGGHRPVPHGHFSGKRPS